MSGAPRVSGVRPSRRGQQVGATPCRTGLEGRKPRRSMLISTRKETVIQSCLNHTCKTDPGALPQRRAIEGPSEDMPCQARNGAKRNVGGPVWISGRAPDGEEAVRGFRTGDIARALAPAGKRRTAHSGRVSARASGPFSVKTASGTVPGICHWRCSIVQRSDGYRYDLDTSRQKGD